MSTATDGASFKHAVNGLDYLVAYVVADGMVQATVWVAGRWRTKQTQLGSTPPATIARTLAGEMIREAI